jgi:hypothetical protein
LYYGNVCQEKHFSSLKCAKLQFLDNKLNELEQESNMLSQTRLRLIRFLVSSGHSELN